MPRTGRQVPCNGCIQRVNLKTQAPIQLCESCLIALRPRRTHRKTLTGTASGDQGSAKEQRLSRPDATTTKADSDNRKTSVLWNDKADLESYSRRLVDAINARAFADPVFNLAVPDFEAEITDLYPRTFTPAEHLENYRNMTEESPQYRMEVNDASVDVEQDGRSAKVFLTIRVTGMPPDLVREALGVFTWRKDVDGWRLTSHVSMRSFVV